MTCALPTSAVAATTEAAVQTAIHHLYSDSEASLGRQYPSHTRDIASAAGLAAAAAFSAALADLTRPCGHSGPTGIPLPDPTIEVAPPMLRQYLGGAQLSVGWDSPVPSSTSSTSTGGTAQGYTVLQVDTRCVQTTAQLQPSMLTRSSSHGLLGVHQRGHIWRQGSCDAAAVSEGCPPHPTFSSTSTNRTFTNSSSSRSNPPGCPLPPPPARPQQQQSLLPPHHRCQEARQQEPPLRSECRQRIPGAAAAVNVTSMAASNAVTQTSVAATDKTSSKSHCGDVSDDPVCRICLEPVTAKEMARGQGLVLGCRCGPQLSTLHTACAERWFCTRRAASCEVCCQPVTNLSPGTLQAIRDAAVLHQLRMHHLALLGLDLPAEGVLDVSQGLATLLTLLPGAVAALLPDRRAQLFLVCYTLFCLVPTCMAAALLVTYFNSGLQLDVPITVVLSILISTSTMLHWLVDPGRKASHLALVVGVLGGVVAGCELALELTQPRAGLDKDATAAAASMLGMLAAMALHYWALLPATRWVSAKAAAAARWLRGQVGRGGRMAPAAAVGQWVYGYA